MQRYFLRGAQYAYGVSFVYFSIKRFKKDHTFGGLTDDILTLDYKEINNFLSNFYLSIHNNYTITLSLYSNIWCYLSRWPG